MRGGSNFFISFRKALVLIHLVAFWKERWTPHQENRTYTRINRSKYDTLVWLCPEVYFGCCAVVQAWMVAFCCCEFVFQNILKNICMISNEKTKSLKKNVCNIYYHTITSNVAPSTVSRYCVTWMNITLLCTSFHWSVPYSSIMGERRNMVNETKYNKYLLKLIRKGFSVFPEYGTSYFSIFGPVFFIILFFFCYTPAKHINMLITIIGSTI